MNSKKVTPARKKLEKDDYKKKQKDRLKFRQPFKVQKK
jgi:hypothetical protein